MEGDDLTTKPYQILLGEKISGGGIVRERESHKTIACVNVNQSYHVG